MKIGYYESNLRYEIVDWFVDEVMKFEKKMASYFKITSKDTILSEEDEENYRRNNICRFCEKEKIMDKVGDHCHLTGKYRGPAHSNCIKNVTQKQSKFNPLTFHIISNYECHLFFKS